MSARKKLALIVLAGGVTLAAVSVLLFVFLPGRWLIGEFIIDNEIRPDMSTVLPLPAELRVLHREKECGMGAEPVCTVDLFIEPARDIPLAEARTQLIEHLERRSWRSREKLEGTFFQLAMKEDTASIEYLADYMARIGSSAVGGTDARRLRTVLQARARSVDRVLVLGVTP